MWPHSLGRSAASAAGGRITDVSATAMTNRSSGSTRSLWTPVGATSRLPSSDGPADAAAGARDPVPSVELAQQLHQQLSGLLVRHHGPRPPIAAAMAAPYGGPQHARVGHERRDELRRV